MHEPADQLRFVTMGSVDDGKSTLIGRLLVDTSNLYEDHLGQLRHLRRAGDELEYGLVLDGLHAEREQGITIDVAYRYFSTPHRRFIIADCPGHVQYTRNMATGASSADAAVLLLDARTGVLEQTRRHAYISALLGVRHVIVAVNKMDLVEYSRQTFDAVTAQLEALAGPLGLPDMHFVPISALRGDNVVDASTNMPWYDGRTVLGYLENVPSASQRRAAPLRFPVQRAVRTNDGFRGYAGTITSGTLRRGDEIAVLPGRRTTRVAEILTFDGPLESACASMAVTVTLSDAVDVSRGDMICGVHEPPHATSRLDATLIWLDEEPLSVDHPYVIKHTTRRARGRIAKVHHRLDMETLTPVMSDRLGLNEIASVSVDLGSPVMVDPYRDMRETGSFIVIDPRTHRTVAAGMVGGDLAPPTVGGTEDAQRAPRAVWLSGPGGAALSPAVAQRLLSALARNPGPRHRVFLAHVGGATPAPVGDGPCLELDDDATEEHIARALAALRDQDERRNR